MKFNDIEQKLLNKLPIGDKDKQTLQRRLNKLKRDPKGFVEDSYVKCKNQARGYLKYLPVRHDGKFQYAIIASVYNVEKYLDDFFESLIHQSLNFKKHIKIICVDDGSTDSSAQIIKKWQKKYRKNIYYTYKQNGGLSSARNFGLDYIINNNLDVDYVTFPDPDDILDKDYFWSLDNLFSKNPNCQIASCNLIYFYEKDNSYKDIHPLKFRYNKTHVVDSNNMKGDLLLSAATAVYKMKLLSSLDIRFDTELKPSFEDCKFNNYLLMRSTPFKVGFVKEARYLYRQRADSSSLMNSSWENKGLFTTVLNLGVLDILRTAKSRLGFVPEHIQRVALFHCIGYYRRLLNADHHVKMLDVDERKEFQQFLKQVFQEYIDSDIIIKCSFPNLQIKTKIGILSLYKNERYPISYVYVNNIDVVNKVIDISFFSGFTDDEVEVSLNGFVIPILEEKFISNNFLDSNFFYERRMRFEYLNEDQLCQININGKKVNLTCFTKSMTGGDVVSSLIAMMNQKTIFLPQKNSWILMDRKDKADDNAEHLYRYLKANHPEEDVYFAISAQSQDWSRLKDDGFALLDYDSDNFTIELQQCKYLISSHLFVWNHLAKISPLALQAKRKIWLQHGVICNNNSNVINTKPMDLMVTSTHEERDSIAGQFTDYNLLPSQVLLSGLPRHDQLLKKSREIAVENIILVMPTWRTWLDDENLSPSNYFNAWSHFLSSEKLLALLKQYGYKIVVAPHQELKNIGVPFLHGDLIEFWNDESESMQDLFAKASFMITDYSSVAFEMAFLKKLVCYYQFDQNEFFGKHYRKGYFDFEQNGFGPLATTEEVLLKNLEDVLANHGNTLEPYTTRIEKIFPFRDGGSCERVYQAIKQLESEDVYSESNSLEKQINFARYSHDWVGIENNLLKLKEISDDSWCEKLDNDICQAMYMQGKYKELCLLLESDTIKQEYWQAKLDFWVENYERFFTYHKKHSTTSIEDSLLSSLAYAYLKDEKNFKKWRVNLLKQNLSLVHLDMLDIISHIMDGNDDKVIWAVDEICLGEKDYWNKSELLAYKPYLIASKIQLNRGLYVESYDYIKKYHKELQRDYVTLLMIARMDFAKQSYKLSVEHYESLMSQGVSLTEEDFLNYMSALNTMGDIVKIDGLMPDLETVLTNNNLLEVYFGVQVRKRVWNDILSVSVMLNDEQKSQFVYEITLANYRLGLIDDAYKYHQKPTLKHCYEYWALIAELALLMGDKDLEKHCYRGMIAIYPEKNKAFNLEKLTLIG